MVETTLGPWRAKFDPRDIDVAGTDVVVVCEVWDRNDYRIDSAHGLKGTVLDIGANIGAFTVLAAKAGARRVIAVEPCASNRERLVHHVKVNHVRRAVTVHAEAVTGLPRGTVRMTGDGGGARLAEGGEQEVATITLTELVHRYGPLSLVKIDIEGGEFEVIGGTARDVFSNIERIAMEWHGPASPHLAHLRGDEFGPLVTKLADCGSVETFGHPARGGLLQWRRY